jgi:4-hydroxybutyryl-CoA synthetase (ADP-forming)
MYLEDMGNGQEFLKVCKNITKKLKKPVLVLKSGRSPEGAKAAMSHTGALMGSDEIYTTTSNSRWFSYCIKCRWTCNYFH